MGMAPEDLLGTLLREVSRSFYLTLRILPRKVRPQIGTAYLLARATDTVADTALLPVNARLDALAALRKRISGEGRTSLDFSDLAKGQGTAGEQALLENIEQAIALLKAFSPPDQVLIREVLETITGGQELDLRRFGAASARNIACLDTAEDLDDYTYRVAGCVGEFWTHLCRRHLFPKAKLDDELLLRRGIRFGRGLQLVNILRDLPKDLREGRCYVPATALRQCGLAPADLLNPSVESRFRAVYDPLLAQAEAHLRAGWEYTNMLPMRVARVRLACAWPVLIGLETLSLLRSNPVLNEERRVKVSRRRVKQIIAKSLMLYCLPSKWRKLGDQQI